MIDEMGNLTMTLAQNEKIAFHAKNHINEIITLGPKGTSSEHVANYYKKHLLNKHPHSSVAIVVLDSFERVLEKIDSKESSCALVPHAYEGINKFYINSTLCCVDMFIRSTPTYGLAKKKKCDLKGFCTIALNPVTTHVLDKLLENFPQICGHQIKQVSSTSTAAILVQSGEADLAITNMNAIDRYNLELIAEYGPITMGWSVFVPKKSSQAEPICN